MLIFSLMTQLVWAEDANSLMQSLQTQQNWTVATQDISLQIHNGKKSKEYQMVTQMRREEDTLYCHARFTSPASVANTQVVWIDRQSDTDTMWLYLPALKRITTLKDKSQSRAFMGSDFDFNDFVLMGLPQTHTIRESTDTVWLIESTPLSKDATPYTKWHTTLSKSSKTPSKIQLFDSSGIVKELKIESVNADGLPIKSTMHTLSDTSSVSSVSSTSSTTLEVHKWDTQTDVPLTHFTKEYLLSSPSQSE